ncbi:MAG: D-alanyl-D-alanine carboxypeptidase family protein [Pseudomonadota bacterium]
MYLRFLFLIIALSSGLQPLSSAAMPTFRTMAKQAILIDANTGKILFEKDAYTLMYPSSMTKIMTAYMVFDQLKQGRLQLDDAFTVSKYAWRKGGSRMFLNVDTQARVEELIRGVIVQSGNDASIVLAEGLSGNETAFAAEMSKRAHELGAKNTTFRNATGWPDPKHLSTAYDLAILSDRLIKDFPDYYQTYFAETEYTYNKIRQMNRNPLLYRNIGADGLKTGQTSVGGFGLVASAVQKGMRLILVINGLKTKGERARESESLMLWGFRNFLTPHIYAAGEEVVRANLWLGNEPDVGLVAEKDLYVTVPRVQAKNLKVEVHFNEPITAPVRGGDVVGKVVVTCPDGEVKEVDLKIDHSVGKAGFSERIRAALYYLFWGHNQKQTTA